MTDDSLWDALNAHRCAICRDRFSLVHGPRVAYSTKDGDVCEDCAKEVPEKIDSEDEQE